ncbi:MAG: hydroxymethylglutaryl-CoA lyase [Henriciella sp.]|jgi:hydroxymethylglutaryl-CoA lyase|uniref:hydroxymethylglutaryl-CoA lyase n=1 Tax=Henriciella sp. TaxID=1968823 RepID=UPI000C0D1127|nr:hydroxymethylglutaryl-CoA lyase [Henriciella sp.]MAN73999.1 hydroxymethylglutaryl-CoA lyase [Henriciella sp.]MBK76165.1 hydroxymethylglutaryl-CoA lyase [Henriciella sp.]PHR82455.1 MAG: hydroxymethylglutaryl-CoA lyase [Henriciella sp.]|tara:strand:+ start:2223 stop:3119 length:897 start_codon:yes stop_codon:yes gene_type:complete
MTRRIDIVEVGPRDGLQNDPGNLTTQQKLEFIQRLEEAGVKRMESGSFVSPKAVPKMADSAEVFAGVDRAKPTRHIALALNEKGVRRAIDAGADEINFVLVAGEGFGKRNQGMSPSESADMLMQCAPLIHEAGIPLSATISVAFGDPYDGEVDPAVVANLAARAQRAGVGELALGDTIGVATPWQVKALTERVLMEAPDVFLRMHFHDTRGAALANVAAAVDIGVDVIDASCGGIGGCPFAPAATGNVATEDVVYMLERAGFETGLDLPKLIETAKWLETVLGHEVSSSLSKAGGFPA